MRNGALAAWPDPVPLPDFRLTIEQIAESTIGRFRRDAVAACTRWREAAAADGWAVRAAYQGEELERAWTAERDGFKVLGIARGELRHGARLATATLSIWGPDGMAISPPPVYDWDAIQRGAATCLECEAHPVETQRVGFVGRYCRPCADRLRPSIERQGWCD